MNIKPSNRLEGTEEYYFSQKLAEINQLRASGSDIINLGIGNPDLPPPPEVIETLQRESALLDCHGYQPYNGIPELRKAFSDWYNRFFHVSLNPDHEILPLIGSKEGITHISLAFLNAGDKALIPDPGYPAYESATRLTGAQPAKYLLTKENDWLPDFDQIENSGLDGIKIMWVNYPNMPTGAVANKDFFIKLLKFGRKHNILICHDNPYSFILNEKPLSILAVEESVGIAIELNSLSKSHNMAGWRVGMAAGSYALIREILKVKSHVDSGIFRPLQLAAVQALKQPDEWYHDLNIVYKRRQVLALELVECLNSTCDPTQKGMFVWAKIPDAYNHSADFSDDILYKARVFLTPGFIFGDQGKKHFRISLCSSEKKLQEAISRIKNIVKN